MGKDFFELIHSISIVEAFKDLYPKHKVEEEVNLRTGIKLYKAFSPFVGKLSNLPQLYFSEEAALGPGYFDFDSGNRGYLPNLLIEKFNDWNSYSEDPIPKKSLEYIANKLKLKLIEKEKNKFFEAFEEIYFQGLIFYYTPIFEQSLLANNSDALTDGSWVNSYTDKWEGWERVE
jgi:hypothetical protein